MREPNPALCFKWSFLSVYFLAQLCEYLQGPYMYAVYSEYHEMPLGSVGLLFFTSSLANSLSGCFLGPLADAYGKSWGCTTFFVLSIISCMLTRSSICFWGLVVGRLLGGTATNLLETAFESFVVNEYHKRGFSHAALEDILAWASGAIGFAAVAAGLAAAAAADQYGSRAPFFLGEIMGYLSLLLLLGLWQEDETAKEGPEKTNDKGEAGVRPCC